MQRLTDYNAARVAEHRAALGIGPDDVVVPGTNLRVDDHLELAGFLPMVVVGSAGEGSGMWLGYYDPWFGDDLYPFDMRDITDRAGPNGETMPVIDEPEEPSP